MKMKITCDMIVFNTVGKSHSISITLNIKNIKIILLYYWFEFYTIDYPIQKIFDIAPFPCSYKALHMYSTCDIEEKNYPQLNLVKPCKIQRKLACHAVKPCQTGQVASGVVPCIAIHHLSHLLSTPEGICLEIIYRQ